jgi:hypothetical protein
MSESYKIEKLNSDQFELLIPLMKACFGMEVNTDYFKWKFIDNPAGAFVGFIARSEKNELAAYYGVIPVKYSINGEQQIVFQSCDTMTHPDHRRKGLFQKLAIHCYNYLRDNSNLNVFGFSGEESTPGFMKFGWSHLFNMRNYFIPKQLNFQASPVIEVRESDSIESLIHNQRSEQTKSPISLMKEEAYLKWRYSNPKRRYLFLSIGQSYLSYYMESDKIFILDNYFDSPLEAKKLLKHLKYLLKTTGLQAIVAFLKERSVDSQQFKSLGFISNPFKKGPLSYRVPFIVLAEDNSFFLGDDNWLPKAIDHDAM